MFTTDGICSRHSLVVRSSHECLSVIRRSRCLSVVFPELEQHRHLVCGMPLLPWTVFSTDVSHSQCARHFLFSLFMPFLSRCFWLITQPNGSAYSLTHGLVSSLASQVAADLIFLPLHFTSWLYMLNLLHWTWVCTLSGGDYANLE